MDNLDRADKAAINAVIALLHRRWAMRLIWELRNGPLTFRALQEATGGISPTIVNRRLKELRAAEIVDHKALGFELTPKGFALVKAAMPLLSWAVRSFSKSPGTARTRTARHRSLRRKG